MYALLNKLALAVTIGLQLVIIIVLVEKRLQRRFLWFLAYIAYDALEAVVRLSVAMIAGSAGDLYFNVYWLTTVGGLALAVLAVRESFLNVFRAYTRLSWFLWAVWGCIGLALLYAVFKAWVFPPFPAKRSSVIIIGLTLAVDYTLAAIGLLYFALTAFFRIKDRQWESGILAGFTVYMIFDIMSLVARSVVGLEFKTAREWAPAIAYLLAEIGWAVVLSRPERKAQGQELNLTVDDLTKLDHHIAVLARLLGRRS
jgi:hypothetical protein